MLPMLGGFLWATGNLCKVPIIKCIGIGMGQIIWATTNCVVGWAIARFGLFGGQAQVRKSEDITKSKIYFANFKGVYFLDS